MITMDYRLIELCRVGDSAAIENFVRTYQRDVYRLALSILDDSTEAEEATQDSLLAALRALDSFRGASSLKTWLYSITVNICRTRLQHSRRRKRLVHALGAVLRLRHTPSVEEDAVRKDADQCLWRAIHIMDEKHRIPMVLRLRRSSSAMASSIWFHPGDLYQAILFCKNRQRHKLDDLTGVSPTAESR